MPNPDRAARLDSPHATPPANGHDLLRDPELLALLAPEGREVRRARQVFVNRNLRLDRIAMVGFDMDYTLAIYRKRSIEELSFDLTLGRLISERGYPSMTGQLKYDHAFVMRGLVVDRLHGNLLKMDRYGHVGRAYHGRTSLAADERRRLYRDEKIVLRGDRFAWIDTLFALPEACLYAMTVELLESARQPVDYDRLYVDIRECIDQVHADDTLKREIRKDLARFILPDPELGPALHKLRSGGKKLFLLTNSDWDYSDQVMRFLLDGRLADYPSWRNYFDLVLCAAAKPAFFSERRPFVEIDPTRGVELGPAHALDRGHVYHAGNLTDLEHLVGIAGERVLYVGDHIYGDILRSKKSSLWRTCMIIEELEDEIAYTEHCIGDISRLAGLEQLLAALDDEVNFRKLALGSLDRRLDREPLSTVARRQIELLRRREKAELERLRHALRQASAEVELIETRVESGFNPYWGLLSTEGTENSSFGEQVEQYACIYTGRVSNLLQYSPTQYFRSPRDFMPHERLDPLPGRTRLLFSPLGSEGPPRGAKGE